MKHLNELIIEKLKITKTNIGFDDNINTLEDAVIYIGENIIQDPSNIKESDIYKFVSFGNTEDDSVYHIKKDMIIPNKNCYDLFKDKIFGEKLSVKKNREQFNIEEVNKDKSFIRIESVNNEIREIYFSNNVRKILINL
jgi:hypothetical protein